MEGEKSTFQKFGTKYDRMDLAMAQEFEMTVDPALGYVPRERLMTARTIAQRSRYFRAAIPDVEWIERGPRNVGGRTRGVMFDPNDNTGMKVFAGSVAGGLWVTSDITVPEPDWQPVNDAFANLAVTTIAYDPTNPTTLYFGTGEGYFNSDAVRGDGIWKSTDGGGTWSQLVNTSGFEFDYVQKIVVDSSGHVFAATRSQYCNLGGVLKSTDGGASWSTVLTGNGPACGAFTFQRAADIEIAANGDLYAAMGLNYTDGVYKSTNGGSSWTQITGGGFPASGFERIELACAPSDSNTVLAVLEDPGGGSDDCYGIYLTNDGGSTWSTLTIPTDVASGNHFTRGQAWYDLIAAFDPNDANRIFLGGVDLYLSENSGSSWSTIGQWYGAGQYVHADQHGLYFLPGNSDKLLIGNDGGVFYSGNASSSSPAIESKSYNYNVTQYYAGDLSPTANTNYFIGGTQDNGSHRLRHAGMNKGVEVTGGDGAFCHIDQDEAQYVFTSYVYNQYRRSTDSGKTFSSVNYSSGTGRFINPSDYDDAADIMYAASNSGDYIRWNDPQTGNSFTPVSASWGGKVSAVTCDPLTSNKVWFGTGSGEVYEVTSAQTGSPVFTDRTGSWGGNYVSCIAIDPSDPNHLLVTFSNYGVTSVYESTNGGSSWTDIEGDLPDMPVRWALFNPDNGDQVLLATEAGVWSTDNLDGSSTSWAPTNTGLATVRVDMLKYRSSDGLVLATTHGRGLFTSDVFTSARADFGSERRVAYIGQPIRFFDNSYQASNYSWDFGDGNNSAQSNPTHSYSAPGKYTVSLTINGASTEAKTDYIHVLPDRNIPYELIDGGNFDVNPDDFGAEQWEGTGFERGNSAVTFKSGTVSGSYAWVTGITESSTDPNSETYLYTPNFEFSQPGTYTLYFSDKYRFEDEYDGYQLQYSTDLGQQWYRWGDYPGFYNSLNTSFTSSFVSEPLMSGTKSNYSERSVDVSALAGNANVAFRFAFKSDGYVNEEGMALDNFHLDGPPTLLPIAGLEFTVQAEKQNAVLSWNSSQEQSINYYEIGHSTDGVHFAQIGLKPVGKGSYSFTHRDLPAGTHYYRLKGVHYDGGFDFSDIRSAVIEGGGLALYPNPVTDQLTIHYNDAWPEGANINVLDRTGRMVYRQTVSRVTQGVELQVASWSPGLYFLRVSTGNQVYAVQRFIKY